MITPFYGEFLTSPIPLELSLNYCSHRCSFCFANLNDPGRVADVKAIMGLLAGYRERRTLEALLLREGYPVTVSNRVDPFAHSNCLQAVPILEAMTQLGIPVCIQTRGGKCVDEVLDFLPPSVWYLSVNTLDDGLRATLEPGAPSIDSRFALMKTLREKGHRVVLGLNPLVREWCPDPAELLATAAGHGAEGVWFGLLHFNQHQVKAMPPRDAANIGAEVIGRARRRDPDPADLGHVLDAVDVAHAISLPTFFAGQYWPSTFFDVYHDTYDRTFPTQQGFVNLCHDGEANLVDFLSWSSYLLPGLPEGDALPIDGYIGSVARNIMREPLVPRLQDWFGQEKCPARMGYLDVLAVIWNEPRHRGNPAGSPAFAYAGVKSEAGWGEVVDEDLEWPVMVFHPNGHPWTTGRVREKSDRGQGWWTMIEAAA